MSDGLGLYMRDVYPNLRTNDTTSTTVADSDDKDALHEGKETSEKSSMDEPTSKSILLALLVLVGCVVFLGVS